MILRRNQREWTRWFSWYPVVTVEGERVWLEWVERRHYVFSLKGRRIVLYRLPG